ncbi:MAG: glutathione S-transferase family protein [Hyphomicrobium sp.]|nr:glutathione S-transferase family protein [Hyphomicrobium sp.]
MIKLWGRKTSINVQKVMWTLAELGLPHERIDAGGTFGRLDTEEFHALNPNRLVPVIEDNGFALWESSAIVRYLARQYGHDTLTPRDMRAQALADQWMEWANTTLYNDINSVCFWGLIRTRASDRNLSSIRDAAKRAGDRLGVLDAHLANRNYILGDQLTIADIPAGALMFRYFSLDIERPALPHVSAWYARLRERPAYSQNVEIDFSSLQVAD